MSKGHIRWYSTIRTKVILVIVVCCTLVLGGVGAYHTISEQRRLTADLQDLARVTSARLSKHLTGPMWDLDRELVDSTLEAEMLEGSIHAIVVWDEGDSAVFSARERAADGRLQASSGAIVGDLIQSSSEVDNGGQSIGRVAVFVSRQALYRQLTESTIDNLITLGVLIAVMATVMTIVMNLIIIGPITRLARHAEDISHGDLKQNIVAESNDEIGQLADAFQRMQSSLRVAFKRIYARARST